MFRRKNYLVEEQQKIYLFYNTLFYICYTMALMVAIFMPTIITLFSDVSIVERYQASSFFFIIMERTWLAIAVGLTVFVILTIFYTHKVFGPIKKIESFINRLKKKDYSARIVLRQGDIMFGLMQEFNNVAVEFDKTSKLVGDITRQYHEMSESMRSWADAQELEPEQKNKFLSLVDQLTQQVDNLEPQSTKENKQEVA